MLSSFKANGKCGLRVQRSQQMERFGVGSLLSSKEFQPVSLVSNFGNYVVPRIVPGHEELLKRIFFSSEFPVNRGFLEGRHGVCFFHGNTTLTCLAPLTSHLLQLSQTTQTASCWSLAARSTSSTALQIQALVLHICLT